MLDSVVKVFSTSTVYFRWKPWQTLYEQAYSGSGFAHVVRALNDHISVHVKRHGSRIKYRAKVLKIAHECDLAILKIDSDEFWEGMNPLELGDIPPLNEIVSLVGYPEGGDNICITQGLVLRYEFKKYVHSDTNLLSIQIDATINNVSSGSPVIMGNKVVGVAYALSQPSKNMGFLIPTSIIKHFITGIQESGQYA